MNDATELAKELKEKEFSFQELVTDIQKKIKKQNHELNAFVALEPFESNSHELLIPQSEKGPLAGIPFPLKMLGQEKKGWLATSGSRLFETHRASHTSNYVRQAEAIGLVPFGQTNAPEFGFKNITDPVIYGSARNPWNLECTPGGSSGGAAAAVSSGIVPLAGASDGGGSIRIPASFCGLIGLKPSRGTMPVGPYAWRGWQGAAIDFGLTVSMRDTEALFYGMRSIHSGAPYQVSPVEWQTHPRKKRLKIAFCVDSPIHSQISEEAVLAVKKAVDFLGKEGHDLTEIPYPLDGRKLITSYYQMNGAETAAMIRSIETGIQSLHVWDEAAIVMENLHQEYDLFLSPTTAFTAPKISEDLQSDAIRAQMEHISDCSEVEALDVVSSMFEESLKITPYTQLANLTGQPAISLPTHLTKENMPLGIQFMAARGREDLLFQIGYLFEANHQFHLPNPWK